MGHRLRARRPRGRGALQHVPTHLHAATIGRAVDLERQQDVTLVVEPAGRVQAGLLVLLSIGRDDARLAVGERGLRRGAGGQETEADDETGEPPGHPEWTDHDFASDAADASRAPVARGGAASRTCVSATVFFFSAGTTTESVAI